jgi:hypothetical protein
MKGNRIFLGMALLAMTVFLAYPAVSAQAQSRDRTDRPAQPASQVKSGTKYVDAHEAQNKEKGEMHNRFSYSAHGSYPRYYGWGWWYGYPYYYGFPYSNDYPFPFFGYRTLERHELHRLAKADMGIVDIHVMPENAEVYLDGRPIGKASHFDGSPGYLRLKAGGYDLALYRNGYQTIEGEIHVRPGVEYKVKATMERGTATLPETP